MKKEFDILSWSPELKPDWKRQIGYEKGDENKPFFSEAYLYNLIGREDARTLLWWFEKNKKYIDWLESQCDIVST